MTKYTPEEILQKSDKFDALIKEFNNYLNTLPKEIINAKSYIVIDGKILVDFLLQANDIWDISYKRKTTEPAWKNIDFYCLKISNDLIFPDKTKFKYNLSLWDCIFMGKVEFMESTFPIAANFSNSTFYGCADFTETTFYGVAMFSGSTFYDRADFNGCAFNWAYFPKAIFKQQADFENTTFKSKSMFMNATFHRAPLFHETKLHQNTSFNGVKFLGGETEDDYRAYRTLKQHMNDVHATLEESKFFALEQRTRRYLDVQDMRKNWPTVTVSYLYDSISSYGQDLLKPVLWLVCTWYAFAGIFSLPGMVGVSDKLKGTWFESIFPGFGYSTQNIFNPLSAVNFLNIDRAFYPYNPVIAFLGWLEAILSIAFIALWLLAVRRRFQKGE